MIIFVKKIALFFVIIISISLESYAAPIPKAPNPDVSSYILMDYDSGMIIASKEEHSILPPASITKIMTAYIAFTELKNKTLGIREDVLVSKKAWKTCLLYTSPSPRD